MKIIAIEKETEGTQADDYKPHLKSEAEKVYELYQSGYFREMYFREDISSSVLILECTNISEAREILDSLPLVQAGLISFELIPLKPYPGFARLFNQKQI